MHEFVNPNWHVALIHAPLGLLIIGTVIELLSFLWPRGGFRAAGRWMILLGALLAIPTALAGVYAFRDVVLPGSGDPQLLPWHEVRARSPWSDMQWTFLSRHIWLNAFAVVAAVLVAVLWLASSDAIRRKLYYPLLALLLASVGLMMAGGWYGGEMVYRHGVAVGQEPVAAPSLGGGHEHGRAGENAARNGAIKRYLPPLQAHIALAGFAVAVAAGALGLTLRKWQSPSLRPGTEPPHNAGPLAHDPAADRIRVEDLARHLPGEEQVVIAEPPPTYPARFWLVAAGVIILAALAGLWSALDAWSGEALRENWHEIRESSHLRLGLHVIGGVSIIVVLIVLAILCRFARHWRILNGVIALLLILLLAGQTWLGILMLYDGHEGPVTGFAVPVSSVARP